MTRMLAAADTRDKFYFPTAYGQYMQEALAAGNAAAFPNAQKYKDGYTPFAGPQGF